MSTIAAEVDRLGAWERRQNSVYQVLPYLAIGVSTALTASADLPGTPPLTGTLLVAAGATAWVGWFITLHPAWMARRRLMGFYFVGLLLFAAVLVLRSPWYAFFAWIGFIHAFLVLTGRWRFAGVAGTALLIATAQSGGIPTALGHLLPFAVILLFNVAVAGALSWFGAAAQQQNANRKRLIAELAEANRKLAETMRENEGLHAQLVVQAREAGIFDERQRMAREIHDTLAQGLTGIITQLEAAEQAEHRQADWRRHVGHAVGLARDSLSEARRSVRAVRPESLAVAQLPDALAELAERWAAINGIATGITTTGTPRQLHPEIEVTLLRTGQEALANVAKHASASRVGLTLSYMEDLVTLDVRDDGVGFEPGRVPVPGPAPDGDAPVHRHDGRNGGFGLTAMRQRIDAVGGRLTVESEPGGGTAISAALPALAGGAS